jgi:hypothetical protein
LPSLELALTPEQFSLLGAVMALLLGWLAARYQHRQLLRHQRENLARAQQQETALQTVNDTLGLLTQEVAGGRSELKALKLAVSAPNERSSAPRAAAESVSSDPPHPFDHALRLIKSGVGDAEVIQRTGVDAGTIALLAKLHRPKTTTPPAPQPASAPPAAPVATDPSKA